MTFPARCLHPGVAFVHIQVFIRWFRARVIQRGFAVVGMKTGILALGVIVPGVNSELMDLAVIVHVDFMDSAQVAVEDRTAGDHPASRIVKTLRGEIPVSEEIAQAFAA